MNIFDLYPDRHGDLDWKPVLQPQAKSARKLLQAFREQTESNVLGALPATLLRSVVSVLHKMLGSAYGVECRSIAAAVGVPVEELLFANLAYDLTQAAGCTTFVVSTPRGPVHARTLDWPFPKDHLRRNTTAYRVHGCPQGDYTIIGWPGLFGVLTAVARGRFSVTVNYVRNTEHSVFGAIHHAFSGHWPVPWLIRRALDEAPDFSSAVRLLQSEEVISPVLITVAGTKNEEKAVIERCPTGYATRKARKRNHLITTNVYQHDSYLEENITVACSECDGGGENARHQRCKHCDGSGVQFEDDSLQRIQYVDDALHSQKPKSCLDAIDVLFDGRGLVAYQNTQHAVAMSARTAEVAVCIPGYAPVTL